MYRIFALFMWILFYSSSALSVSLEAGSLCSNGICINYKIDASVKRIIATPVWMDIKTKPPVSSAEAVDIAQKWFDKVYPDLTTKRQIEQINLKRHMLSYFGKDKPEMSDNWYYVINLIVPISNKGPVVTSVVVLFDGSVVEPIMEKSN